MQAAAPALSRKRPRIGDHVPVAGKALDALHGGEIDRRVLQDGVGRLRVVGHGKVCRVPRYGRAAQALEDAELDLVRGQRVQAVEAMGKTLQRFAGQAEDEVGVHVGVALAHQPAAGCRRF